MLIDGREVPRVLRPASAGELIEIVRDVSGSLAPIGAGSQLSFGNPLAPVAAAVDLTGLDQVTGYVPADMTIHVEAGLRLERLAQILSEQGQMLPVDPWCGSQATIGGVVATNAQGAFRPTGTIRDWIIGMRVVDAGGRQSRTGGRVVKNVSGYDLAKLYTGSLGSLGIVSEVSLKLRARYDATASARIRLPDVASAFGVVRAISAGPCDPVSFVWAGPDNEIRLRFGEHRKAVDWQLDHLPRGDWETLRGDEEADLWAGTRQQFLELPEPVLRVIVLPGRMPEVIRRFQPAGWLAQAGSGVLYMTVDSEQIPKIRQEFSAILERAPLDVRQKVPTFGLDGTAYEIMRKLKAALDPGGRLNPGRHVDGEYREEGEHRE